MALDTERLNFEEFSINNFEEATDIFRHPYVRKYLLDDRILSEDELLDFLKTSIRSFENEGSGLWMLRFKVTSELIGFVGLWNFFEEQQPQLLYALLPEFAGKGYAKEASQKVIAYAFEELGFTYLDAACDTPNESSRRLAEALGMQFLKQISGDEQETTFYRLLNEAKEPVS